MNAYPILDTPRGRSAFLLPDPEGAPGPGGMRYHGAIDWFASGGAPVYAAGSGKVVESRPSNDDSGQVFGGALKIQAPEGHVYVYRHCLPGRNVGNTVEVGDKVAVVAPWRDGPEHIHFELWKTFGGGYAIANMIDPGSLNWTEEGPPKPPGYWLEELPWHPYDAPQNVGPRVLGAFSRKKRDLEFRAMFNNSQIVSKVSFGDRFYIYHWKPGTYARQFRFGPWDTEASQNKAEKALEEAWFGHQLRPFKGRERSLYPYPDRESS